MDFGLVQATLNRKPSGCRSSVSADIQQPTTESIHGSEAANAICLKATRWLYITATRVILFSAVAIAGLGFFGLTTIQLLLALILLMLVPVFWAIRTWITVFGARDDPHGAMNES